MFDDDPFEQIRDVLASIGRRLEEVEDLFPLDNHNRIPLLVEEGDDGILCTRSASLELIDPRGQLPDVVALSSTARASARRSVESEMISVSRRAPGLTCRIL